MKVYDIYIVHVQTMTQALQCLFIQFPNPARSQVGMYITCYVHNMYIMCHDNGNFQAPLRDVYGNGVRVLFQSQHDLSCVLHSACKKEHERENSLN